MTEKQRNQERNKRLSSILQEFGGSFNPDFGYDGPPIFGAEKGFKGWKVLTNYVTRKKNMADMIDTTINSLYESKVEDFAAGLKKAHREKKERDLAKNNRFRLVRRRN